MATGPNRQRSPRSVDGVLEYADEVFTHAVARLCRLGLVVRVEAGDDDVDDDDDDDVAGGE